MNSATPLSYLAGFGNQHTSESIAGALPSGRNNPQRAAHGLYTELLSGTAFTAPRAANLRSWLYRRRPSVQAGSFTRLPHQWLKTGARGGVAAPPDPMRWHPPAIPDAKEQPLDFIDGLRTWVVNGDEQAQTGMAAHLVLANRSMTRRAFVNADGEMLIVPQQGRLRDHHRTRPCSRSHPARSRWCRAAWRSRSRCPTAPRAPTSARTTARRSACPSSGRSAPTAWPTRAISSRRSPPPKTTTAATSW